MFCVSETDVTSYYLHNKGIQCIQEQLKLSFYWKKKSQAKMDKSLHYSFVISVQHNLNIK